MTTTEAKEVLRNAGYFVDNLWSIDDVINVDDSLSKEQAMQVLSMSLTNDTTMEQIWYSIKVSTEILTDKIK